MNDDLLSDFLEESIDLIEKVRCALKDWDKTQDKEEAINSIYRWVHTIKGGCSIFEYKETAAMAHELENFLGVLRKTADKIDHAALEKIKRGIEEISCSLNGEERPHTTEPVSGKDEQKMEEGFKTKHFQSFIDDHSGMLTDMQRDGLTFFEIAFPSENVSRMLDKLQSYGFISMESRSLGNETACLLAFSSKNNPEHVKVVEELFHKFKGQWLKNESKKTIESPSEDLQSPHQKTSSTQRSRSLAKSESNQKDEVLRVPLSTVNSILDHIWELFLVRNQLSHFFKEHKDLFKDNYGFIQQFESLDNVLERNIHDLESKTMSLRLSSIKRVFDRMDKVVHEYCNQSGKKIHFTTKGEGIDLDKKVLDQLNEPLIHLIRNAIDHGIETPQERDKAKKDPTGSVELSAQIHGNEVSILISDDGKGIDPQKILESAKKKNLDVSGLKTDQDIIDLIFAPGFSTAEKVTDVSGRGVGMDAVKSSIQELGGTVTLSTAVGKGTIFRINLPLTMSVSKSLIVNVRGLEYAISTKSITSVEKIDVYDLKINGKDKYYDFNGKLIPCYDLGSILTDHRAEPDLPISNTQVCVTSIQGQDIAFTVDEILLTLNMVMKPLPKSVKKNPLIGGVSLLPGGSPIFVLNIHECMTSIMKQSKGGANGQRVA